jgi:uncharacterized repeat protein (TIGR01451 family)
MKKLIFILLVFIGHSSYGQILPLTNYCGDTTFDLTVMGDLVTVNQTPGQFTISYYETQSDSENNINPIVNPTNYQATAAQQTLFIRIVNPNVITLMPFGLVVNTTLNVGMNATLNNPSSNFLAFAEGGQEPYSYQWSANGTAISGATTNDIYVLDFPSGTTFTVTIIDANGCTGSASMISSFPQNSINANDDNFTFTNQDGGISPPGVGNILNNDTLNSFPATLNSVSISLVSTTNSNIGITPQGWVNANSQTPSGNYTLVYQICEWANPNNCDIATVNILVDYCRAATPVIDSLVQPNCQSQFGSITLSGLPEVGSWIISYNQNGGPITSISGTGTTFSIQNLNSGNYRLNVIGDDILLANCYASFDLNFTINYQLSDITVTMSGAYEDYNNDGYTNVGDVVNYSFTVSNNGCNDITNISLANQMLTIVGEPIAVLTSNTSDSSTFTASYVITQGDINEGNVTNTIAVLGTSNGNQIVNDYILTLGLNLSDGIKLHAFLDNNSNGIQDGLEPNFTYGQFHYDINSGLVTHSAPSNGTLFIYESNPINSYNISYTIDGPFANHYTVAPATYSNITVANGSGITTYNFPVTVIPFSDLSVQLYNYGAPPRPGFIYQNYITYTNYGNQTIASGTVTFVKDPLLTITNISVPGTVSNANGFTLDFVNLLPNQTRYIVVSIQVPTIPTVALGQQLTNTCSVSIPANDTNINNNTSNLTQTIVGSYDPNDKAEKHGGEVVFSNFTADNYLTYTIRFENTGTANAVNVKVDDLLDSQLDETSVTTISASHQFVLKRINNALSWHFDGIDLPPSVEGDAVTGHGYIVFQIKPKTGFALGDVIPNTANIYFDFNPAIVTNTCTTEFVPFLGIDAFDSSTFEYYPNPTSGIVTFNMKNTSTTIDNIEVTDILGKTLFSKTIDYRDAAIDLSIFEKGIYLITLKANGQQKTFKIAKQ